MGSRSGGGRDVVAMASSRCGVHECVGGGGWGGSRNRWVMHHGAWLHTYLPLPLPTPNLPPCLPLPCPCPCLPHPSLPPDMSED